MATVSPIDLPDVSSTDQHRSAARPGQYWRWYWVMLMLAPLPMLAPYLTRLWQLQHYQYFPLVLISVGCLAHGRSDGKAYPPRGAVGWGLVILGIGATIAGLALLSPWIGAVAFVLLGSSCLLSLRGPGDRSLILLALPLLMLIRVPLNLDELLIIRLQGWTTRFASVLLDLVGIAHVATGNVIGLVSRELFVAEACSGIQSVFTLLFLACLIIAYKRHPLWFVPIYAAAAVLMAILGNSLRVGIVAAADAWFAADWTAGWRHELVGYFTLTIATLSLLSFDQFMMALFHRIKINDLDPTRDPLVDAWNWVVTSGTIPEAGTTQEPVAELPREQQAEPPPIAHPPTATHGQAATAGAAVPAGVTLAMRAGLLSLSVILASLSLFQVVRVWSGVAVKREPTTAYFVPPPNLLEGAFDAVQVVNYEVARNSENPRLGTAADIWTISDGRFNAQLVLSQPYFGWHELCYCYQNLDWQLIDRSILAAQPASDAPPQGGAGDDDSTAYAMAHFHREDGRFGYLLFSAITYEAEVVEPPIGVDTAAGAAARVIGRLAQGDRMSSDEMMMLQLWIEVPQKLTSQELQVLKKSFQQTRSRIAAAVKASREAPVLTAAR